jgi:aminoglycoside phosphotransferase (APT) family kinase protein
MVGLDTDGSRLIKFTNNALFALDREQVVVRIAGSAPIAALADTVVAAARWFAEHDLPTIRLWEHAPQPLSVDGLTVTLWHQVPENRAEATGAQLGDFLKRLHLLNTVPAGIKPWRQLEATRSRIVTGRAYMTDDQEKNLIAVADQIARELADVRYVLEPGPIFGDAQIGNVIAGLEGAVMCDFDSVAVGPREWDLVPAAVAQARFDFPVDHHAQLAEAYGLDITTWEHYDTFRRLRELQLLGSVLPIIATSTRIRDQWEHRYATINEPDATWELFES